MKPRSVELRIEELVLHGLASGDHSRIGDAVERELAHLFAEQGMAPSLLQEGEIARLNGGTFEVKPSSGAEAIGVQVAESVYGGLS
jgi:hypothetical protein